MVDYILLEAFLIHLEEVAEAAEIRQAVLEVAAVEVTALVQMELLRMELQIQAAVLVVVRIMASVVQVVRVS
jgi:hypothetical protein